MSFIQWLVIHTLCFIGFILTYRSASKAIRIQKKLAKRFTCFLLFLAVEFYVIGYVTPINPLCTILIAYFLTIVCIIIGKVGAAK